MTTKPSIEYLIREVLRCREGERVAEERRRQSTEDCRVAERAQCEADKALVAAMMKRGQTTGLFREDGTFFFVAIADYPGRTLVCEVQPEDCK